MLKSIFISLLNRAPIHYGCLLNWRSHSPVDQSILIEIGDSLSIEPSLVTVAPNVFDQLDERIFVDTIADDILVGPRQRVSFCIDPAARADKLSQVNG